MRLIDKGEYQARYDSCTLPNHRSKVLFIGVKREVEEVVKSKSALHCLTNHGIAIWSDSKVGEAMIGRRWSGKG